MIGARNVVGWFAYTPLSGRTFSPGKRVDVWSQMVTSFMTIFATPAVTLCSTMLSMDRLTHVSNQFFNAAEGGDHLLWQHLFWFFGRPDVYIFFIPATSFISTIIPTFCRRKIVGY